MSIESSRSTTSESVSTGQNLTTYEWFESKFENLKAHLQKIDAYQPEIGLWLSKLEIISFPMFLEIFQSNCEDETPRQMIMRFAEKESFNIKKIKDDDLNKLERYIELFRSCSQ
jgi:hypothetical protein